MFLFLLKWVSRVLLVFSMDMFKVWLSCVMVVVLLSFMEFFDGLCWLGWWVGSWIF